MSASRLNQLIELSLQQAASEDELHELAYLCQLPENQELSKILIREALEQSKNLADMPASTAETIRLTIISHGHRDNMQPPGRYRFLWVRYAAAIIILLSVVGTLALYNYNIISAPLASNEKSTPIAPITPGGNKATLTLDDGTVIVLDSSMNGELQGTGSVKVIKLADGLLSYAPQSAAAPTTKGYSTIATPRGGQYMIELPDRSKVWLNAASSIRFPNVFENTGRQVEVTGEVYFEVAKAISAESTNIPFIVNCRNMTVNVLGTHFNIMGYEDEHWIQTTLLEGKINVSKNGSTINLNPGEQVNLTKQGEFTKHRVTDPEKIIAWKNGQFELDGDIQGIMRQLARWYDVSVKYEGNVTDKKFGGTISRTEQLSEILKMLELTENIKFRTQDKTITVTP